MATKDWPQVPSPDAESWGLEYNTQVFTSDLNGAIQTAELPGARWTVDMTFSNRQGLDSRKLQAFLSSLGGRAGRFYVTPVDWEPFGNPDGTPSVAANAGDGVTSISTTGWTAGLTIFQPGDYFELNGELKKVIAEAASDINGNATIEFAPPLRKAVTTGMTLRVQEPRCVMMLSDDKQASWALSAPIIYAVNIEAREALDI